MTTTMATEITRIEQRNQNDCMVCCLAMAAGLTYEDVLEMLPCAPGDMVTVGDMEIPYGVTPYEATVLMMRAGRAAGYFTLMESTGEGWPVANVDTDGLRRCLRAFETPAVVIVESQIGLHAMTWDPVRRVLINPMRGAGQPVDLDLITPVGYVCVH